MMSLRNIFIVGAAKSGTTALYYLLNQHPRICFPIVKEPNYFCNIDGKQDIVKPGKGPGDKSTTWTKTFEEYMALFRCSKNHQARLDASVSYLYSTQAASNIAAYSPDASVIIVLRNPADRAWSHYKHLIRDGREHRSFEEALALEEERIDKDWEFSWHLKAMGLYSQQVQRYYKQFDPDQIQIYLFEDIKADITKVISELLDFLQLDSFDFNFEQTRHNVSGVSRSKLLAGFVNWMVGYKATINKIIPPRVTHHLMQQFRTFNTKEEELPLREETRQQLISYFREDIKKTEQLIGRDLSSWLN